MKLINDINPDIPSKLKKNINLIKGGINYGAVIATEVYDQSFMALVKQIVKCLFFEFSISFTGKGRDKLFVYSLGYSKRKDYDEIKSKFLNFFPDYTLVNVNRKIDSLHIINKICKILYKYFFYKREKVPSPFLTAVLITEYGYLEKKYKKINWENVDLLGVFFDARCEDNLAVQLGLNAGAKTFTLQHGQYRILRPGFENSDSEAYKNFISDRLLAWGEATKEEFKKIGINENRVIPVGALKSFSYNKKMNKIIDNKVFGLILCADSYYLSNVRMITLANDISCRLRMKYFVRFHPKNKILLYKKYLIQDNLEGVSFDLNNEEYANMVTFSIVHMTGVFVEMLSINSPIFIYEDECLEDVFKIKDFCIRNIDEFLKKWYSYKNKLSTLKEEQYQYYRYYNHGGILYDNYKNALNSMEMMKNEIKKI